MKAAAVITSAYLVALILLALSDLQRVRFADVVDVAVVGAAAFALWSATQQREEMSLAAAALLAGGVLGASFFPSVSLLVAVAIALLTLVALLTIGRWKSAAWLPVGMIVGYSVTWIALAHR